MLNEQEKRQAIALFGNDSSKDLVIRLITHSLLGSATITAPEIKKCLHTVESLLNTEEKKVNTPDRSVE